MEEHGSRFIKPHVVAVTSLLGGLQPPRSEESIENKE